MQTYIKTHQKCEERTAANNSNNQTQTFKPRAGGRCSEPGSFPQTTAGPDITEATFTAELGDSVSAAAVRD